MRVETLEYYGSYFDKNNKPLELCFDRKTIHVEGVKVILDRLPYLISKETNRIFFPVPAVVIIEKTISRAKEQGKKECKINQLNRFNRLKLPAAGKSKFNYSAAEHFFIPGLIRDMPSDGYLTPVYFDKNILTKYRFGDGYEIHSETKSFGVIKIEGVKSLPYGVNSKGAVVMWLGDIVNLPQKELMYLYSENIEPQFDLHSDFYNNQILGQEF